MFVYWAFFVNCTRNNGITILLPLFFFTFYRLLQVLIPCPSGFVLLRLLYGFVDWPKGQPSMFFLGSLNV